MDANILNQFIKATGEVFEQVCQLQLRKAGLKLHETGEKFKVEVATILGIAGELRGQMVVVLTEPVACKFASSLLMGTPVDSYNEMAESGVCEMANMIAGKAAQFLHTIGYTIDISVPSIVRGKDVEISFFPRTPVFVLNFDSDWGNIQLVVRIEVSKDDKK